jgi:hypothetical protein
MKYLIFLVYSIIPLNTVQALDNCCVCSPKTDELQNITYDLQDFTQKDNGNYRCGFTENPKIRATYTDHDKCLGDIEKKCKN